MRYKLVSDNDGHDYIIPEGQEVQFYTWVDCVECTEADCDAAEEFGDEFEKCRIKNSNWTFIDPQGWQ